jgi:hypothetical protein
VIDYPGSQSLQMYHRATCISDFSFGGWHVRNKGTQIARRALIIAREIASFCPRGNN